MSTIFVNGFDFETDEDIISKHFSTVGAIKELHFQSRGAAVITYEKESSATRAVKELHETTIKGQSRYCAVKLDERGTESKGKSGGKGKGSSGKGGGEASDRTIFITGFDFATDDAAINKHFGKMGAIEALHFQSKWACVVTFAKAAAAQKAITELDGSTMAGQDRFVNVRLDGKAGKGKGSSKGEGKSKGKGSSWRPSGTDKSVEGRSIYVSGFDFGTDEDTVKAHFGDVGTIESLYFQSKAACVITYTQEAAAQKALDELAGSTMKGQTRYVAIKMDNAAHRKGSGKGKGK